MKAGLTVILFVLVCYAPVRAQERYYSGALGGVATLSADAATAVDAGGAAVSLYRPFNGPALNAFVGVHLNDVVTLQGNYVWNRNRLTTFSTRRRPGAEDLAEDDRTLAQQAALGDVLIYFRDRNQRVRPYLSGGLGVVRLETRRRAVTLERGEARLLPATFSAVLPAFRVAVGLDVSLRAGWSFRYSFSETLQTNEVSRRLDPPGERNLANFQNLFGIAKRF